MKHRMTAVALATSVALMASGCANRFDNVMLMGVGGAVAVSGGAVLAGGTSAESDGGFFPGAAGHLGVAVILLGLGVMVGGAISYGADPKSPAPVPVTRLDQLAMHARDAARAHDCVQVRTTIDAIEMIDDDYHSVLVAEPSITACLPPVTSP